MDFKKALETVRSKAKKRNFVQSVDMVINFTGVDFSKPDKRIDTEIFLPAGRGKDVKVVVIAGDELLAEAKKHADSVLTKAEISKFGKDKKALKKFVGDVDFLLCQTTLMAEVGRQMGQVLGPKGKMPKPVPPQAKLEPLIQRLKKTVRLKSKGKFLPTLHTLVGTEEMSDEDIIKNISAVYSTVRDKLQNKELNIRSVYIKTTMGPAVKVE